MLDYYFPPAMFICVIQPLHYIGKVKRRHLQCSNNNNLTCRTNVLISNYPFSVSEDALSIVLSKSLGEEFLVSLYGALKNTSSLGAHNFISLFHESSCKMYNTLKGQNYNTS